STKGASKARRDHINREIHCLRSLLPLGDEDKQRLSYLHSMALVNIFIRSNVYCPVVDLEPPPPPPGGLEFLQAVPGFLVTMTTSGNLIHLSDNVRDFLGLSMVELVSQGDSFYQMISPEDQKIVRETLESATAPNSECTFLCQMHCSKAMRLQGGDQRMVLVRGRFVSTQASALRTPQLIFTALCTPVLWASRGTEFSPCVNRFQSQQTADLKITSVSDSVVYLLGYQRQEFCGMSWYNLVHPADLSLNCAQHSQM
ncbi:neuronal PAS domain-containing protein 4-like, partial [Scyliorhinus torazame]|uniref:neuronal PAS domain-containing protein 4-like n=1 Tax=Scyliorhinus torazame TaxID=75743 RepID=UPI003B59096B